LRGPLLELSGKRKKGFVTAVTERSPPTLLV